MKISVAICTWNRSRLLQQTLESFCAMESDLRFDWELIVVDNNSHDDTQAVIQSFTDQLPIVSLFEKVQGHSHSRNQAVATASGDYLVWTDNDVLVPKHWLTAYYEAFIRDPGTAFFGGEIAPQFEQTPPAWLEETWHLCKPVYATRQLGDEMIALDKTRLPYGANFAIRMDIQKQFLFDTAVGRKGAGMLGEDETSVLQSICDGGHAGLWVPRAGLKHFIPVDRMTEQYIRNYFQGRGMNNVSSGRFRRNRLICLIESLHEGICYRVKRHRKSSQEWVSHMIRSSLSWGEFRGPR